MSVSNIPQISWSNLTIDTEVGKGSYSTVYRGKHNNREVAIRELFFKKLPAHLEKEFTQDVQKIRECSKYPCIVSLLGICKEPERLAMIMEYMPNGSLFDALKNQDIDLPWQPTRIQIAVDIGNGLAYLHANGILHLDLRSTNILLDNTLHAKLTDFGFATIKFEAKTNYRFNKSYVQPFYMKAPELFRRGKKHSQASDVYSYGMVLWEIASRKIPFVNLANSEAMQRIKEGKLEEVPQDADPIYQEQLKLARSLDETKRPSAKEIAEALQKLLPQEIIKCWHYDPNTKSLGDQMQQDYVLLDATPADFRKVEACYSHHPVPGYKVHSVKVIHNPVLSRRFSLHLQVWNSRYGNPIFMPKWPANLSDTKLAWRKEVYRMFEKLAKSHVDSDFPHMKLLPVWHGAKRSALESICEGGYANLGTTDAGFFGSGIYFTPEAKYAHQVYAKGGVLFLNWVAIFSPFPFVRDDDPLQHSSGHDARFIPVSPRNPNNPNEINYDACLPNKQHTYTEIVMMEPAACLPSYVVELKKI